MQGQMQAALERQIGQMVMQIISQQTQIETLLAEIATLKKEAENVGN